MILAPFARLILRAAVFLAAALPAAVIDLRSFRIPDMLSLGGLLALIAFDLATQAPDLPSSAAAGGFSFLLFSLVRKLTGGLGMGDVKYAATLGFFAGPRLLPLALLVAASGGLVYALVVLRLLKRPSPERIAFGPFLSAGGLAAAVFSALRHPG